MVAGAWWQVGGGRWVVGGVDTAPNTRGVAHRGQHQAIASGGFGKHHPKRSENALQHRTGAHRVAHRLG